jgi:hypothetical protein
LLTQKKANLFGLEFFLKCWKQLASCFTRLKLATTKSACFLATTKSACFLATTKSACFLATTKSACFLATTKSACFLNIQPQNPQRYNRNIVKTGAKL